MTIRKGNDIIAGRIIIDSAISSKSENAVQNKVVSEALDEKQNISNLVTSVSSSSTDNQYPSAKCLYDQLGNIESLINSL